MTERDQLLRRILDDPADDGARLVYADWLDEHGENERAEFIRVEIELADTGLTECDQKVVKTRDDERRWQVQRLKCGKCRFCELERRAEQFHETPELWKLIIGDVPFGYSHTSRHHLQFRHNDGFVWPALFTRRGFVDRLHTNVHAFLSCDHKDVFSCQPVTQVILGDRHPAHESSDGWYWRKADSRNLPMDHDIPPELWWGNPGNHFLTFRTAEAAIDMLSRRSVNYARTHCGLSPLYDPKQFVASAYGLR